MGASLVKIFTNPHLELRKAAIVVAKLPQWPLHLILLSKYLDFFGPKVFNICQHMPTECRSRSANAFSPLSTDTLAGNAEF